MTEDEGGEEAPEAGESDATGERGTDWSAVPDRGDDDPDIPLPWNTVTREESDSEDIETGNDGDDESTDGAGGDSGETTGDSGETTGDSEPSDAPDNFEDLRFVGPKSAAALRDSDVSLSDLVEKRVAYRDLKEAGVNPGVAAKIRREHSLSWSLDGGGTDLDRRSTQIRGLDDDERAWIAASSGWSEEEAATETDGSGDATEAEAAWRARTGPEASSERDRPETAGEAAWRDGTGDEAGASEAEDRSEPSAIDAESAWRERSVPTPVTALDGIDEGAAASLRRAGIGSVRRLATADPESVADALELDRDRVETWCRLAREHDS